jgi:hypothetical protein
MIWRWGSLSFIGAVASVVAVVHLLQLAPG